MITSDYSCITLYSFKTFNTTSCLLYSLGKSHVKVLPNHHGYLVKLY